MSRCVDFWNGLYRGEIVLNPGDTREFNKSSLGQILDMVEPSLNMTPTSYTFRINEDLEVQTFL